MAVRIDEVVAFMEVGPEGMPWEPEFGFDIAYLMEQGMHPDQYKIISYQNEGWEVCYRVNVTTLKEAKAVISDLVDEKYLYAQGFKKKSDEHRLAVQNYERTLNLEEMEVQRLKEMVRRLGGDPDQGA